MLKVMANTRYNKAKPRNRAVWKWLDYSLSSVIVVIGRLDMSHELSHDPDIDCVVLRVEGTVTLERIRKMAPEVARICEETGCRRLLNDMSETTIDISVTGLFTSPEIMDESNVSPRIRRALVVPPSFDESKFLENVSRNRSHNLMVFRDIEEAKKWLLAEQ